MSWTHGSMCETLPPTVTKLLVVGKATRFGINYFSRRGRNPASIWAKQGSLRGLLEQQTGCISLQQHYRYTEDTTAMYMTYHIRAAWMQWWQHRETIGRQRVWRETGNQLHTAGPASTSPDTRSLSCDAEFDFVSASQHSNIHWYTADTCTFTRPLKDTNHAWHARNMKIKAHQIIHR